MSADIVDFSSRRAVPVLGDPARDVLVSIALTLPSGARLPEAEAWADWLGEELWARGFKVARLE